MKTCHRCKEQKSLDEFNVCKGRSDGRQSRCRDCDKKSALVYYNNNKDKFAKRRIAYKKRKREWVWDYLLNNPCIDCGASDPRVLEFDHVDQSTKVDNISALVHTATLKNVIAEIEKCEVRCANCHRIKTYEQLGWWQGSIAETV